jgi:hypothetical protein
MQIHSNFTLLSQKLLYPRDNAPRSRPTSRRIFIPATFEHQGLYRLDLVVPWNCIYCGEERGEPFEGFSYDGSLRMNVTCWENPCGHVESYEAIRQWWKTQAEVSR